MFLDAGTVCERLQLVRSEREMSERITAEAAESYWETLRAASIAGPRR